MTHDPNLDRRTVLAGGAALTVGTLAGCTAGGQGDSTDETTAADSDGSESATTDAGDTATESDETPSETVEVGPDRRLEFEPSGREPLVVASGTTVEFVWKSDVHNVVVDDQPNAADWEGSPGGPDDVYDEGYSFSHTFDAPGIYEFHCEPHESVGMTGTIFVTPDDVPPEYATPDDLPVEVGPGGALVFSPGTVRPLKVPAGTEVEFVWGSVEHNVVVESQPKTGDWEGTPGDPTTLYDEGYEYSHTFEIPGVYEFFCQAHRSAGMVGTIVVEEE